METNIFKMIEFVMLFTLIFGFGFHQLWSLKREERRRLKAEADAAARGEAPPPPSIPAWMRDRSDRFRRSEAPADANLDSERPAVFPPAASTPASPRGGDQAAA